MTGGKNPAKAANGKRDKQKSLNQVGVGALKKGGGIILELDLGGKKKAVLEPKDSSASDPERHPCGAYHSLLKRKSKTLC